MLCMQENTVPMNRAVASKKNYYGRGADFALFPQSWLIIPMGIKVKRLRFLNYSMRKPSILGILLVSHYISLTIMI